MMQMSRWKIIVVVAAVILSTLFALPNLLPASVRDSLPPFMPKNTLNLGLDLQGGSYLLLEVETDALQKERVRNLAEDVVRVLQQEGIAQGEVVLETNGVIVPITNEPQVANAFNVLNRQLPSPTRTGALDMNISRLSDQRIRLRYTDQAINEIAAGAVDQSIEIIRRRVDELGTREPSINREGSNRIVVQAAGESDPEKLKDIIGQTAKLTFQMVNSDREQFALAMSGQIPPGSELLPNSDGTGMTLVRRRVEVSGEMLTRAQQGSNPETGEIVVEFSLNGEGARRFGQVTSANIGRPFAIILDGKVISAPVINSAITGGSGYISGNFDIRGANELAILLRAGALPAPLTVEEQRTVGAELGADAVEAGKISIIIAFVSVLVFMTLSYGLLFGGISVAALVVNGMMIVAAMSATQATLTLPGIAGLILTLAVAVDANVLIYERMRDEVRSGRTPLAAADAGFSRAMVTIFDANITTLGAAVIMFGLGAGPVKGFAWTLLIGVFTSVFTAVLITQVLLALWFRSARPKKLPIV